MANVTVIPEDYDALKKEYLLLRKELDSVNQELHEGKRQLKIVEALQSDYQNEIEMLQSEEYIKKQKFEEKIAHQEELISNIKSEYNKRVQALENNLANEEEKNEALKSEIEFLKKDVFQQSTGTDSELSEEIIQLKHQNEIILENDEKLKLCLDDLQKKNSALEETLTECKEELSCLKENLLCKREELFEANDLVQKLNDELFCLKSELETYKSKPLNEESKGNSLFAEVDDRRVYLQKTINTMKSEYISMKQERAKHLNLISHLRKENKTLCDRWKADMEEKDEDQHMMFKVFKDRIQILENLVLKYKRDLLSKPVVISTGTFSEIEFYQIMLNKKAKELEELRDQLATRGLTQTVLSTSLKDANKETRKWRLEATLMQCQLELKSSDATLEIKVKEKLEDDVENQRVELRQTKKGPNLACRENKVSDFNLQRKLSDDVYCDIKKEEVIKTEMININKVSEYNEIIPINDSSDIEQIIDLRHDSDEETSDCEKIQIEEEREQHIDIKNHSQFDDDDDEEETEEQKMDSDEKPNDCDGKDNSNIDPEDKENKNTNTAPRKVTFSESTVSPKVTDRTALRANCKRIVVPKPIYIPTD